MCPHSTASIPIRPPCVPLSGLPPPSPSRGLRTSVSLNGEMKTIECPAFAESISEGDLRWEKQVGDSVAVDEVVCEIETDKTSVPVPSPVAGVLRKQLVEDGATVSPGNKLAEVEVGAEGAAAAPAAEKPKEEVPKKEEAPAAAAPPPAEVAPIPTTPPPTPSTPTGPSASVPPPPPRQAAPPAAPQSSGPAPVVRVPPADPTKEIAGTRSEHRVKMNRMRQKIAKTLKDAQNTNAMLTTFNELDMRWE